MSRGYSHQQSYETLVFKVSFSKLCIGSILEGIAIIGLCKLANLTSFPPTEAHFPQPPSQIASIGNPVNNPI